MSRKKVGELSPFFSIVMVIATLFSVVFFKMEVRRMGYLVLKESSEYNVWQDQKRLQEIEYAAISRPERVRQLAQSRLTLSEARNGQIIQLTGSEIAIRQ